MDIGAKFEEIALRCSSNTMIPRMGQTTRKHNASLLVQRHKKRTEGERKTREDIKKSYPRLALLHVQPVLVELDNVGVFDLHQVLKHLLDLLLKSIDQRLFTSSHHIIDQVKSVKIP